MCVFFHHRGATHSALIVSLLLGVSLLPHHVVPRPLGFHSFPRGLLFSLVSVGSFVLDPILISSVVAELLVNGPSAFSCRSVLFAVLKCPSNSCGHHIYPVALSITFFPLVVYPFKFLNTAAHCVPFHQLLLPYANRYRRILMEASCNPQGDDREDIRSLHSMSIL